MINLVNGTTDLLSLITSSGADIDVVVNWVDDLNPGTNPSSTSTDLMTPGRTVTQPTTAATTTICATPASATVRNVKSIYMRNIDTSVANTLTLQYNNNGTLVTMCKFTLAANEFAIVNDAGALFVYDVSGGVKSGASSPLSSLSGAVLTTQIPNGITTINTARQSQVVVSATNYYITSSGVPVPANAVNGIVVGTSFRWRYHIDKTAAGTGIFQCSIYRGTAGSTADTQDVLQTIGTQTAVADNMVVDVTVTCTVAGATGSYFWSICPLQQAATATGFGVVTGTTGLFTGTVASVAMNTASLIFGLGVKATTGTPTLSFPLVIGEAINLD